MRSRNYMPPLAVALLLSCEPIASAVDHARRIERGKAEIKALAFAVGAEQVERALWWAGPDPDRLECARANLAAGQTISENGQWGPPPQMLCPVDFTAAVAKLHEQAAKR